MVGLDGTVESWWKEHKRIWVAIIGAKTFGQFCRCSFYCPAVTAMFQHFI